MITNNEGKSISGLTINLPVTLTLVVCKIYKPER